MAKLVYIVMCDCPLFVSANGLLLSNGDERYHIDSVWTSERKANKRCEELNAEEKAEWREDYGFGLFSVEQQWIHK